MQDEQFLLFVCEYQTLARPLVSKVVHVTKVCEVVIPDDAVETTVDVKGAEERVQTLPSICYGSARKALQFFDIAVKDEGGIVVEVSSCKDFPEHVTVMKKVVGPAAVAHVQVAEDDDTARIVDRYFLGRRVHSLKRALAVVVATFVHEKNMYPGVLDERENSTMTVLNVPCCA